MKQKKYSESKIKTAQKFLSNYELSFDALAEHQKKAVINYTHGQKYLTLCLVVFTFTLAVFIVGAYLSYNRAFTGIDKIVELSKSGEVINLQKYGEFCLNKGASVGMYSFSALYTFLYIITLPLILKSKRQIFDAFLPRLKRLSGNEKTSDN